ncbi:MAG TPA: AAA family ATPase [Ignavibacteria bacterium]|nr:AAA family ATPase [Ignavibacteria bacterium]
MWNRIIGQERVKKIVNTVFKSEKIAHSYIFYGKEGVGKDAVALEFAKMLNCETPVNGEACDKCKSCVQINNFNSPFVKFIMPLPTGGKDTDDDDSVNDLKQEDYETLREEINNKIEDIYHKIRIPKANFIRINSIRDIKNSIYLSEGNKKKVYIISDADMMNPQSANALLKILEEPPKNSILILTTSRLNSLLPTIIGRCQKIQFDDLSLDEIKKYIRSKDSSLSEKDLDMYAELSGGSIYNCNKILSGYFLEVKDKVLDYLMFLLSNKYLSLGNVIDNINDGKEKEKMKQFLLFLIYWFRDLALLNAGNEKMILNHDKLDRLKKFNENFKTNFFKVISEIEDTFRDIDLNINPELIFFKLSFRLKQNIVRK